LTNGTPLPNALSGVIVQRLIEIDEALLYLISGALSGMLLKEPLEQTGALTPETAQNALSVMLETYLNGALNMTPVGVIMMWQEVVAPANWLLCDGGAAFVAEWPDLFALWGYRYGGAGTQFGLPAIGNRSPMGAGGVVDLNDTAGELQHTLTTDEMPSHTHPPLSPSTTFLGNKPGGTNTMPASTFIGTSVTTGATGGGLPHNIVHPVWGTNFIVHAGRQVT
jgi:microcystin-dependent protein